MFLSVCIWAVINGLIIMRAGLCLFLCRRLMVLYIYLGANQWHTHHQQNDGEQRDYAGNQ